MSKHTKAGRRARFRAFCDRTTEVVYGVPPSRPLADRCYGGRCGGTGWLECWCGFCGEEQCYGCSDCRDSEARLDDTDSWTDDDQDARDESAFMRGVA